MCQVKHIWQCLPKRSGRVTIKHIPTAVFVSIGMYFCNNAKVVLGLWLRRYCLGVFRCWLVAIVVFPYLAGRNKSPFQKEAKYIHSNCRPLAQEPSEIRAGKLEWHFANIQSYDKENQRKTGRIAQHLYTQFRKPKGKWKTIQTYPTTDYK